MERKATLIKFNPLAINIISVNKEINKDNSCNTFDLEGEYNKKKEIKLPKKEKEDVILKDIEKGISRKHYE